MRLQKQRDTRLNRIQPKLEKAVLQARVVKEDIRNGRREKEQEEGEEETRKSLDFQERRVWDKMSPRKKGHYLRAGRRKAAGDQNTPLIPGKRVPRSQGEHGVTANVNRDRHGRRISHMEEREGWRTEGTGKERTYTMTGGKAATAKTPGKDAAGTAAGSAGKAAQAGGSAAGGVIGVSAAAAKKSADKFREALQSSHTAGAKAEAAWMETASARMEEARSSASVIGSVRNVTAALAAYVMAKTAVLIATVVTTFVTMFAALLPALLVIVLVVVLIVSLLPFLSGSGGGGADIVVVARQELEAASENIGGRKYKDWYYGLNANWCAMFVTWCADQCGYVESGVVPKEGSVANLREWYSQKNLYHEKEGYAPKPGDLIIFEGLSSTGIRRSHTGIVEAYDEVSQIVTTIEGNTGSGGRGHEYSSVHRYAYPISDTQITGFCSPDYPASVGELTGGTNAEKVYRAYVDVGYTPEAASAVVGNLAGEGGTDASGDIVINSTENGGAGEGVGICQWSFGRKDAFLSYAAAQGEPWPGTSLSVQLSFMMMELSSNGWLWTPIGAEYGSQYNISHAEFKMSTDLAFATTAFCANFERCHAVDSNIDVRIAYAQKVLASYGMYNSGNGSGETEKETTVNEEE